jgi:hypothetical protein
MIWLRTSKGECRAINARWRSSCGTVAVRLLAALFVASQLNTFAVADIIHSDVNGDSVWFTSIQEGSPTGDPLPLYGQPFAISDQLVFTPTGGFSATSQGGSTPDQTDGKLTFMIEAKPGNFIDVINVNESGVTSLTAPFGGDAFTSLLAYADIKVLQVNGVNVNAPTTNHFFNFNPASSFLFSDVATGPTYASSWQGSLSVNLPDMVTKVLVSLDNVLTASTMGVGTTALIDKKSFSISVDPDGPIVPEPGTVMLGLLGMVSLLVHRGRERF